MTTQKDDLLSSLFEHRDQRIDRLGNPLTELGAAIDCEAFRPLLDRTRTKARKSPAERKPPDVVLMFKSLVLASLYNLSDEQLESRSRTAAVSSASLAYRMPSMPRIATASGCSGSR